MFKFLNSINVLKGVQKLELAEKQVNSYLDLIKTACSSEQNKTEEIIKLKEEINDYNEKLTRSKSSNESEIQKNITLTKGTKNYIDQINTLRKEQRDVFKESHDFLKNIMNLIN